MVVLEMQEIRVVVAVFCRWFQVEGCSDRDPMDVYQRIGNRGGPEVNC